MGASTCIHGASVEITPLLVRSTSATWMQRIFTLNFRPPRWRNTYRRFWAAQLISSTKLVRIGILFRKISWALEHVIEISAPLLVLSSFIFRLYIFYAWYRALFVFLFVNSVFFHYQVLGFKSGLGLSASQARKNHLSTGYLLCIYPGLENRAARSTYLVADGISEGRWIN